MIEWGLIKNNLKLMLRSKWILFLMIILPLLTMGVLSSVFDEYLGNDYDIGKIEAMYVMEESILPAAIPAWQAFMNGLKNHDIYLQEYAGHDYQDLLDNEECDLFIVIGTDEISIYKSAEKELEAMILVGAISAFVQEFYGNIVLAEYLFASLDAPSGLITANKASVNPVPSAMDYYGIIYVVYFAWCGMASLAMVIASERKNKIESRLQISPATKLSLYLGKVIPCFLATTLEIGVTVVLSILLFDVHWGKMWVSLGVLLLMCLTISAVGVFLFYLFRSIVLSIATAYISLMVMGYLGGSFATYMYGVPESLSRFSFIYYINRTLVELSTMGKSEYLRSCMIYLTIMILFSALTGMWLMRKSMERQG